MFFNNEIIPLPASYSVSLSDVEADSGGVAETGTTQRNVVREGVVQIRVTFRVSKKWLNKFSADKKLASITVGYLGMETMNIVDTQMYIDGYQAKLVSDTSYGSLWEVSFVLKKFQISQPALTFQIYKCSVWLVDLGMSCNYNNVKNNCKGEKYMRKYYLDNIRWVTVVLVVIYHVIYMYNGEGILGGVGKITSLDVQYYDIFLYAVYPWFMLLLFLVSGICSRYYLDSHTAKEFAKSRTRKLLIPSTLGLFAFQFIQGYVSMSISDAFDSMQEVPAVIKYFIMVLSGTGVLWYIQLLWLFSMVLLLIRKIDKDRLWKLGGKANIIAILLMAPVIWGAAQILNTPVVVVYRFGYYGAAFLLGYFVFSHDEVIAALKKYFVLLLVLGAVVGTVFCIKYFGDNYADAPVNRSILFTVFGWLAGMAILSGAAKYADKQNAFTVWMSKNNFGLYVFHYLGISTAALLLGKSGNLPAAMIYIISLIAGFVAAYALNAVISRIPFFKWAVLGIKKERKNDVS